MDTFLETPTTSTQNSTRFRHRGPITCVAHVPSTRLVLTSAYDGAVALLDLDSGDCELLGYHEHLANRIAISRDGKTAASSSADYTIRLWDIQSRTLKRTLIGHSDDVEDFVFIGDHAAASCSQDQRVYFWNLESGAVTHIAHDHQRCVLSVVYAEGRVYSAGDDMMLREWSFPDGRCLRTWGPFENETDSCAIDTMRRRIVLGCDDGHIRVFDLVDGSQIGDIDAHKSGIKRVTTCPETGNILSAAYDQRVLVWNAETFELAVEMNSLSSVWERSLNWSADGRRAFAGTFDGTVIEWDVATGERLIEHGSDTGETGNACFNEVSASGDGVISLVSDDGHIRTACLTPTEASWIDRVEPASGRILMNAVTFDRASHLVAAGAHNQTVHLFTECAGRLEDGIEVFLGEGPVNSLRVSHHPGHEDEIYAACYSGAIVRIGRDGKIRGRFQAHHGAVKALRLHHKQPTGVSCSAEGSVVSWKLDGTRIDTYLGHTSIVDDVDISPFGDLICSVSRDFTMKIFELDTGRIRLSLCIGHRSPKAVCFFDDDTVVLSDYWGALLKCDLRSGRIDKRTIARNGISSVARYGSFLLASSYDGSVTLVRVSDLEIINVIRAMTQRLDEVSAA